MLRPSHALQRLTAASCAAVLVAATIGGAQAHAETGENFDARACQSQKGTGSVAYKPWQVDRLGLPDLWKMTDSQGNKLNGSGVTIAVIDTGTSNLNSAYFDASNVTTLNYLPRDPEAEKNAGGVDCIHGTQVTSLIVSKHLPETGTDFAGVAPGAKVIAMRTLAASVPNEDKPGDPQYIYKAIDDAIARKVDIINISQTMSNGTPQYAAAIKRALDAGIIVVASAGNTLEDGERPGARGPLYPASYPGVIAVGMTNAQDQPAEGSYQHPEEQVTIGAPGTLVMVLRPTAPKANQAFHQDTGTSFSAPLVTGVIALLLQKEPGLTPAEVKQRLMETADPPTRAVPDPQIGAGIINPMRFITGARVNSSTGPRPSPSFSPIIETPPPAVDPMPQRIALGAAIGAGSLTVLGLIIRIVVPAAGRRGFRAAKK